VPASRVLVSHVWGVEIGTTFRRVSEMLPSLSALQLVTTLQGVFGRRGRRGGVVYVIGFSGRLLTTTPPWHENGNVGTAGYRGDAGDAGAAPSRLRRPRDSERAVAGRRGGSATPAHCGWFAMAKSNVAGFEYQYGGGTSRRKSSSAAFMVAMV